MIKCDIPVKADWIKNTKMTFPFHIFGPDDQTPLDITGYTLDWIVRRTVSEADPPVIQKGPASITISGTYNANPLLNTQRANVPIDPVDTASLDAGVYFHELKRTDTGLQTVLTQGEAVLQETAHH